MQKTCCKELAFGLAVINMEIAKTVASFLSSYFYETWSSFGSYNSLIAVVTNYFAVVLLLETTWKISSRCKDTTYNKIFSWIILFLLLATAIFFVIPKKIFSILISFGMLQWHLTRRLWFLLAEVLYEALVLSCSLAFVCVQTRTLVLGIVLIYFFDLWSKPAPNLCFSNCGFPD